MMAQISEVNLTEMPDEGAEARPLFLEKIRARVVLISPAYARVMLSTMYFDLQRNVSERHVRYLTDAMRQGQLTDMILIECQFPDTRRVLIDGYHRLNALLAYDKPMLAVIVTYRVETDKELAVRYATLDRPRIRTASDMIRAAGLEADSGLKPHQLKDLSTAATLVEQRFDPNALYAGHNLITRTEYTTAWMDEGLAFFQAIEGCSNEVRKLLTRSPVMAVALATFRWQPDMATSFWRSVALEDGLKKGMPQHTLLKWLRAYKVQGTLPRKLYPKYVAVAWNAYFHDRSVELLKVPNPEWNIVIDGTPFRRGGFAVMDPPGSIDSEGGN